MGGDKASVVAIDSNRFGSFVKNMNLQADPPKIARIAQPERTNPPDRSGIFGWVCLGIGSIFMEERKTRRAGHPTRRKTRVEHRQILAIVLSVVSAGGSENGMAVTERQLRLSTQITSIPPGKVESPSGSTEDRPNRAARANQSPGQERNLRLGLLGNRFDIHGGKKNPASRPSHSEKNAGRAPADLGHPFQASAGVRPSRC